MYTFITALSVLWINFGVWLIKTQKIKLWPVHIDSLAQDYAVAEKELELAVSKRASLHQSGPDRAGDVPSP